MRLLFVTAPDLGSRLIRAADGGNASHVGVQLSDGSVIDSTWTHGGVRAWSEADFWAAHKGRRLVDAVSLVVPREHQADAFLRDQVGRPYDKTGLLGFVVWHDFSEPDAWYCSELAAQAAIVGGRTLADRPRRIGVRLLHEVARAWAV